MGMIKPKVDPALSILVGTMVIILAYFLIHVGMKMYQDPMSALVIVGSFAAFGVVWLIGEVTIRILEWIRSQ